MDHQDRPVPNYSDTFYHKKHLLSVKTCLNGIAVSPSHVAVLSLANANLQSDDARTFHQMKPRMDASTRAKGLKRDTMLRSIHFFAAAANLAARKAESSKNASDIRLYCECVVREWKPARDSSPEARLDFSALLPEGLDPYSQNGQEAMMAILDRCSPAALEMQLHHMLRANCDEPDNVLGWRLWLVTDPECIASRPANAFVNAIHATIANTDKALQPLSKVEADWGHHVMIESVQDAYKTCRTCSGMPLGATPDPAEILPCHLWGSVGTTMFYNNNCAEPQRERGHTYLSPVRTGRDQTWFLRFPYPGSVFEISIRGDIKPASLSFTMFPDKYFAELRRKRLRSRGELSDEEPVRNTRPCINAQEYQRRIDDCPQMASQLGISLSENASVRAEQIAEALAMPEDIGGIEDSLKSCHTEGDAIEDGPAFDNMDSLKEWVFQPAEDAAAFPAAYERYASMVNVLPTTQGSMTIPLTMRQINMDRTQPWFHEAPAIDIYHMGKTLSVWGHFIRHNRIYLDYMEQFVSNHTEFILLYIQTLDSFRSSYNDIRLSFLFDGDKATGKTFVCKTVDRMSYGIDFKNRCTTAALIGGPQQCHRTVIFDETPPFLQHDRSSDQAAQQNHSSIKSFLTDQLVVETRGSWKPTGKTRRNPLESITSKNLVMINLTVMQNMAVSKVDHVLASRFCAFHVLSVQRPNKSKEEAERALDSIKKEKLAIREQYPQFMKQIAAHTFDVWQFVSRGTFKITTLCNQQSENRLARLFSNSTVPIDFQDRFWIKVSLFVKNITIMQGVIATLTLFPDVVPLSADAYAGASGMKFLETVSRLLYDSTQIVTWAVDVLVTELLDPMHEQVRLAMLPLFSDRRTLIEDTGDRKIINPNYILTSVKICEGAGNARPGGGFLAAMLLELATKIHQNLRGNISKPSLYTLQNSLTWMGNDFNLRLYKTDTTPEDIRANSDVRVECFCTEERERQPLLRHFKGMGWGIHRDMLTLNLSLIAGALSDGVTDYAEAIQLNLTEPRNIVRGFSVYQYAQLAGKSMHDKSSSEISDAFVYPEITTFTQRSERHEYVNAAHMSRSCMAMLNMPMEDRDRMKKNKQTVVVDGDMDQKSFESHMEMLQVPREEWPKYDMRELVKNKFTTRGY